MRGEVPGPRAKFAAAWSAWQRDRRSLGTFPGRSYAESEPQCDNTVMSRTVLAAVLLAGAPALALGQSASAPLVVTATVVSTCKVEVPKSAEAASFATMPVAVTCARRGSVPRVQRPTAPRRSRGEVRDAVLVIDF